MATVNCTIQYGNTQLSESSENTPFSITYGGNTLATIVGAGTKTLSCTGKYATTDIVIGGKTLKCKDKIMSGNVVVTTVASTTDYTLSLSGTFNSTYAYAKINGTKYTSATSRTVASGETLLIHVAATRSTYDSSCSVKLNGTTVQSGKGEYTWAVTSNATVTFARTSHKAGFSTYYSYKVTITTN